MKEEINNMRAKLAQQQKENEWVFTDKFFGSERWSLKSNQVILSN